MSVRLSKPSTKLSASALSYLSSLESSSKALQNSLKEDKPSSKAKVNIGSGVKKADVHTEKPRKLSKTFTLDSLSFDSDDHNSDDSFLKNSMGGEKIILDLGFDNSEPSASILPKGKPGNQVGRKSLVEIRELRNSIDQSLKPTLPLSSKRNESKTSTSSRNQIQEHEVEPQTTQQTKKSIKKSPFNLKSDSNSDSSDLESLDFQVESEIPEKLHNGRRVSFKESSDHSLSSISSRSSVSSVSTVSEASSKSNSDNSTRSSSTVTESHSTSSKFSSSSKSSTTSSSSSNSSSSTLKQRLNNTSTKRKTRSVSSSSANSTARSISDLSSVNSRADLLDPIDEIEKTEQEEIVQQFVGSPKRKQEDKKQPMKFENSLELGKANEPSMLENSEKKKNPSFKEAVTQTSSRICDDNSRKEHPVGFELKLPSFPSDLNNANLDYFVKEIVSHHIRLIREFNEQEWRSVREWTRILNEDIKTFNPTTKKRLLAIIEQRLKQ